MNVSEARQSLIDQLSTIKDVRVYGDPGATIQPPGIIVGVPSLEWAGMFVEPTSAEFTITYSVKMDSRSPERLLEAVQQVSEAITDPDFSIVSASSGVIVSNNTELPSYSFVVSVALGY